MDRKDGLALKRKAACSYREAQTLRNASQWTGAANRVYYAVYQALVGEFVTRDHRADEFGDVDPRYPDKWPHWVVVQHGKALGLDRSEVELVGQAEALRVKADYKVEPVESWAVEDVLEKVPDLFVGLGVSLQP